MMALTGHVATTVPPVGDDTHTVEYNDGELATDALTDLDAVGLPVRDAMKPPVLDADADTERDADRLPDADAVTLKPRVCDLDGVGVGDTSTHCA